MNLKYFLKQYLRARPLFLSLIRAKEAFLYQKNLPLKRPVLDVGVGDGYFASVTFVKNFKLNENIINVGLDLPDSRIKEARRVGIYKKLVTYDGVKMPFGKNEFKTVVSNCVLEHIPNLKFTVGEIHRVLKPGGIFLTTVMAKPWDENLFGARLLGEAYKSWMRKRQVHLNLLDNKSWDKVFKETGFKIVEKVGYLSPNACQLIDVSHYFSILSLVSYKLFGRWILFPKLGKYIYPVNFFVKILSKNLNPDRSGAIFYVLQKKMV